MLEKEYFERATAINDTARNSTGCRIAGDITKPDIEFVAIKSVTLPEAF